MTMDGMSRPAGGYEPLTPLTIQDQARRYLESRYGKNVWFRAPETFGNMLERWIWALACSSAEIAEQSITEIEAHFEAERGQES